MTNKNSWYDAVEALTKAQMLQVLGTYLYDGYAEHTENELHAVLHTHILNGDIPPYAVGEASTKR